MARTRLLETTRQCLSQRRSAAEYEQILAAYSKHEKTNGVLIISSLVQASTHAYWHNDPLLSVYLRSIILSKRATVRDCLYVCIRAWQRQSSDETVHENQAMVVRQLIADLAILVSNTTLHAPEVSVCIVLCSRWLQKICSLLAADGKATTQDFHPLANALATLLVTLLNAHQIVNTLDSATGISTHSIKNAVKSAIRASADDFPIISLQLSSEASRHSVFDDSTLDGKHSLSTSHTTALEFEQSLTEPPIVATRTATYVLLQTLLSKSLTIDDQALYNYLAVRHVSDAAAMFNDLLYASFDVLTKPPYSEDSVYQTQCCIFLFNKLPVILAEIASSLQVVSAESYLLELWTELCTSQRRNTVAIAKQFMHICSLHHLISAEQAQNVLGDTTDVIATKGLVRKQALVSQVTANASRGTRLVDELSKNDGNVAAFVHAIVDTVAEWCQKRETHHLKELSNKILRQPFVINSIAMFVTPSDFLGPLCCLLDEWSWEDIHGESQPMYEEFGSILLLVMVFKFKLGLTDEHLGLHSRTGFLARYLTLGHSEKQLKRMSSEEESRLGDWIHNLYESEGISDEVTSRCSAKDFHLMVPTLLHQSLAAFRAGKLPQERLEGGLDYLLEPFLLPSLLLTFTWLAHAVIRDHDSAIIAIRRLSRTPENPETRKLHSTIMSISRSIFSAALQTRSLLPHYSDVLTLFDHYPLLDAAFAESQNIPSDSLSSIDGPIVKAQKAIVDLVMSTSFEFQPVLVTNAILASGPSSVVMCLITLLVQNASASRFQSLIDIIATIVACSNADGISLADSLRLLHARLEILLDRGVPLSLQAMLYLYRRVNLYIDALTSHPPAGKHDSNNEDLELMDVNLDQTIQDMESSKTAPIVAPAPISDQSLNEATGMTVDLEAANDLNIGDLNGMTDWNDEFQMDEIETLDFDEYYS